MLRRIMVTLAAVMVVGTGIPRAEADSGLGLFGSYLDSEDLGTGWGGGTKLKFDLGKYIGMDLRTSFIEFQDLDYQLIPFEATLLLQLPLGRRQNFIPYAGIGGGYYYWLRTKEEYKPDDDFGYFPIAGLTLSLGQSTSLFAEARWLYFSSDNESRNAGISEPNKVSLDGLGINAGFLFRF